LLSGVSVGFVPGSSEWRTIPDSQWDPELGPDHVDTVIRKSARLVEVSLVSTPAYLGAEVVVAEPPTSPP
jgi:phage head maturation protease